jgi:predicted O-linked N-acetylglucosamine transferase (SPINDLY family)
MRLLGAVEGSVLWLLAAHPAAEANLRREAAARGIDPARLVFADKMEHHAHLGRLAHADLFLDSFTVNAHTTCSDALWAGLPVLTMAGRSFAARVGASLLMAAGLPELVTTSPAEYEARALEIALAPQKLAALRARLQGRETNTLFATAPFTRKLESAFCAMHARHIAHLPPADIDMARD